ncbi:Zn-dependent exopeptidase [Fomitiporia mediterranea MF3/22]|uniref:Zn-dependent exopeptidase n=1 Tax=Fomitiporia mediterranea (strain MF3/22) TaxID=694068 RepID=UPI00044079AB|nr:Zn-dependent exopeptidase [Fomitiporia mediterranea MF3/22]EJD00928.1 Zn-dependent exopeptidase [Fomitiporia mediterranea MF3/22]
MTPPPDEKLEELEPALPKEFEDEYSDSEEVEHAPLSRGQKRSSRTKTRLIVFLTSVLCLWLWMVGKRKVDEMSSGIPHEEFDISWPFVVSDLDNEAEAEEVQLPHHPHKRPRILNGKPAEKIFLDVPNNVSAIETSRRFAGKPHMAGTQGDYDTAIDFLHLLQTELGIPSTSTDPVFKAGSPESRNATLSIAKQNSPSAWVDTYFPILNSPVNHSLEILEDDGKTVWTAQLEEIAEDELDPDAGKYAEAVPAFHGLSRGGEVQGKLVYVNYGRKEDYDALEDAGVNFNGTIVLARYGGVFRGLKVKGAQERGAVGCLIYSDPRDDGSVRYHNGYAAYPLGPARNPTSVQRGSVQFISLYPGDPTTPGYPSYENSTRTNGENIPKIPSLPLSWNTASRLLQEIETGGRNRVIKLVNNVDVKVTPIWNTMAVIPGHIKDEVVVVGNHRDAWVLGATDPTSGTVSTYEVIRGLGVLLKKGWKPLRTIVIASWDAEEYGLIGSTEWGEDFPEWIDNNVVAYLNLDSSVSGSRFRLSASPSLAHLVSGAAKDIPHPTIPGKTLWQARFDSGPLHGAVDEEALCVWEEQWGEPLIEPEDLDDSDSLRIAVKGGSKANADGVPVRSESTSVGALGSGSDYTVFLQRIGVASTNGGFGSTLSDPVYHYHSVFDSETWQERYGDPGFHRHVAVAKHLGLQLLRLADAVVLPVNTTHYAYELDLYLNKVEEIAQQKGLTTDFSELRSSVSKLQKASVSLDEEKASAEKHLKRLLKKWWRRHHGHGKSWGRKAHKVLKKICSWFGLGDKCTRKTMMDGGMFGLDRDQPKDLGASHRLKPRVGRFPAWVKEREEEKRHAHHHHHAHAHHHHHHHHGHHVHGGWKLAKKLFKAVRRIQASNAKLVTFERGFISEEGIKDREWFRHLGVAPGKWLGYGATTFPGLTEALTFDNNATLAQEEAKRLQALIDALAKDLKV